MNTCILNYFSKFKDLIYTEFANDPQNLWDSLVNKKFDWNFINYYVDREKGES